MTNEQEAGYVKKYEAKDQKRVYNVKNWIGQDAAKVRVFPKQAEPYGCEGTIAIQSSNTELSYTLHLTKQQAIDLAGALLEFAESESEVVTA